MGKPAATYLVRQARGRTSRLAPPLHRFHSPPAPAPAPARRLMPRIFWPILSILALAVLAAPADSASAQQPAAADTSRPVVLVPAAVWDGVAEAPVRGWVVVVRGERIVAAGPSARVEVPASAERMELAGTTLMPGLIEGHSHLFLHPYDETLWDDQVLKEPRGLRMARAVAHAAATVRCRLHHGARPRHRGWPTTTCGCGGPSSRASCPDRACSRPPERSSPPAATARGAPTTRSTRRRAPRRRRRGAIVRVVRDQIGRGADWIKVYADYGWGPDGEGGRRSPRRSSTCWWRPRGVPARRWRRTRRRRRGCGGRCSRASRRSSTATTGRPRCSG